MHQNIKRSLRQVTNPFFPFICCWENTENSADKISIILHIYQHGPLKMLNNQWGTKARSPEVMNKCEISQYVQTVEENIVYKENDCICNPSALPENIKWTLGSEKLLASIQ